MLGLLIAFLCDPGLAQEQARKRAPTMTMEGAASSAKQEQKRHEGAAGDRLELVEKNGGKVLALNDLDVAIAMMYAEQHGYDMVSVLAKFESQGRISIVKSGTIGIYEEAKSQEARNNTLSGLSCNNGSQYLTHTPCLQWVKVRLPSGRSVWVTVDHLKINREDIGK